MISETEVFTDLTGKYWGNDGAGCVFYCTGTNRMLIAHRSEDVNEPNTWGVWGGQIDSGETAEKAVRREVREEAGYTGDYDLKLAFVFKDKTFRYTTYVAFVDEEFRPKLDWETQGYKWCELNNLPENLHFGLVAALPNIRQVIKSEQEKQTV